MLLKRIALIGGLSLAFMAPIAHATEPDNASAQATTLDDASTERRVRNMVLSTLTGCSSGWLYGSLLAEGSLVKLAMATFLIENAKKAAFEALEKPFDEKGEANPNLQEIAIDDGVSTLGAMGTYLLINGAQWTITANDVFNTWCTLMFLSILTR
jgi:hypothetical protein